MSNVVSREIRLKSYPVGIPNDRDFELIETTVPEPKHGEVLVRNIYMSVDPYMRVRMTNQQSYMPSFRLGQTLEGGSVGQVVLSKNADFRTGEFVFSNRGWREHYVCDASELMKLNPSVAPIQAHLGIIGMTGLTAYVGLLEIGQLKEGDTVFISAASGSVGAAACQIAKIKGCRVIGSAGSSEKVAWLKDEVGIDESFNYRLTENIAVELGRRCPNGIDVYFDNVGGEHLEAALAHMNSFGRIVLCGMISQYNATEVAPGPRNLRVAVRKRLTLKGFIVSDHLDLQSQFYSDMARWISETKIKWKETIFEGIENAPKALIGLFQGENLGKMLVKIGPDTAHPVDLQRLSTACQTY